MEGSLYARHGSEHFSFIGSFDNNENHKVSTIMIFIL